MGPFPPQLFVELRHLELPTRAYTFFESSNLVYVGDLVRMSKNDLVRQPNLGRTTIRHLEAALESLGLALGMKILNWEYLDHRNVAACISPENSMRRLRARGPATLLAIADDFEPQGPETLREPSSVEEEVEGLLGACLKPRSMNVMAVRIAWREEDAPTLAVIGHAFQLTRERIRQIIADATKRVSRTRSTASLTQRCLDSVSSQVPAELTEVEEALVREGLILPGTRLRAVFTAAKALGLQPDFAIQNRGAASYVVASVGQRTNRSPDNQVRRGWGATSEDEVWVEYAVSKASLKNGVFSVPNSFEKLGRKRFVVRDADGHTLSELRIKNGVVWGFRPVLDELNLSSGDVIRVTFDVSDGIATVETMMAPVDPRATSDYL